MNYRNENGDVINSNNIKIIHNKIQKRKISNPRELDLEECGYKKIEDTKFPEFDYTTHTVNISWQETETSWKRIYTLRELTEDEKEMYKEV